MFTHKISFTIFDVGMTPLFQYSGRVQLDTERERGRINRGVKRLVIIIDDRILKWV
mgnify:FL=1